MRRPAALCLFLALGCGVIDFGRLDPRWRPDAALQSPAAHTCYLEVGAAAPWETRWSDVDACIAALPEGEDVVLLHESPGGPVVQEVPTRTWQGVPVEVVRHGDGWTRVRLESGTKGWVRREDVPFSLLH